MYSSFYYFFIIFIIIIFVSICSITAYSSVDNINVVLNFNRESYVLSANFAWPIPGFTKITSPYGARTAPTSRCFKLSSWN